MRAEATAANVGLKADQQQFDQQQAQMDPSQMGPPAGPPDMPPEADPTRMGGPVPPPGLSDRIRALAQQRGQVAVDPGQGEPVINQGAA